MEIKFYWIQGINKVDTPRFTNIEEQKEYFDNLYKYSVITEAFYPPHAIIELKVDTSDVDFNTSTNYISFDYDNITYYYFINTYRYINENIISFSLTMDTIQTYYFKTQQITGLLDRMTMRKKQPISTYIKENPSQSKIYIPYDIKNNIINTDVTVDIIQYYAGGYTTASNGSYTYTLPYYVIFQPYYKGRKINTIVLGSDKYTTSGRLETDTKTIKAFGGIPLEYFVKDYKISVGSTLSDISLTLTNNYNELLFDWVKDGDNRYLSLSAIYYDKLFEKNAYTLNSIFTNNTEKNVEKNKLFCPYLMHNNCFRIRYGEMDNLKIVEMSKYSTESITMHYLFDIETGQRIYSVGELNNVYKDIIYGTSTSEKALGTTAYQQYAESNSISRYMGYAISGVTTAVGTYMGNPKMALEGLTSMTSLSSKQGDIANAPGTMFNSSSALTTFICKFIQPILIVEEVEDIRGCRDYFEKYGMKADFEYSPNTLNIIHSRYYYDYIQYSEVVTTFNCLVSEQIKQDFESRLKNGVRLWSVDTGINIGSYSYDNIDY